VTYEHPELTPFFSREFDNGRRHEQLFVLSNRDGVLITASANNTRFECTRVVIPTFPGASPYNFTKVGETELLLTVEDVTDYVDIVGERRMLVVTELLYEEEYDE
jgi:hypothetical protein